MNTFVLVKVGKVLQETDILVEDWRAFRGEAERSLKFYGQRRP